VGGSRILWEPTNHSTLETFSFATAPPHGGYSTDCQPSLRHSNPFVKDSPKMAKTMQLIPLWHFTSVATKMGQAPDLTEFNQWGLWVHISKSSPCTCHKYIWGVQLQCHSFLNSALDKGKWSASRPSHFIPDTQRTGSWIWSGQKSLPPAENRTTTSRLPSPYTNH
jgi:hypothetical protein